MVPVAGLPEGLWVGVTDLSGEPTQVPVVMLVGADGTRELHHLVDPGAAPVDVVARAVPPGALEAVTVVNWTDEDLVLEGPGGSLVVCPSRLRAGPWLTPDREGTEARVGAKAPARVLWEVPGLGDRTWCVVPRWVAMRARWPGLVWLSPGGRLRGWFPTG